MKILWPSTILGCSSRFRECHGWCPRCSHMVSLKWDRSVFTLIVEVQCTESMESIHNHGNISFTLPLYSPCHVLLTYWLWIGLLVIKPKHLNHVKLRTDSYYYLYCVVVCCVYRWEFQKPICIVSNKGPALSGSD